MKKIIATSSFLLLSIFMFACSKPASTPQPSSIQSGTREGAGTIVEIDPSLKAIVPTGANIEKLSNGFAFVEGPIWVTQGAEALLFSDIPRNSIMKWTPDGNISLFRKPSGYTGPPELASAYCGSNGMTLDKAGRLIICEHGDRCVSRLEQNGTTTLLAGKYEGKKLNSPNDVICKSDGSLYFTDPPYGLANDKDAELNFSGIYRIKPDGKLQLLSKELNRPNGLAFSPDEKVLYVSNSDSEHRFWEAFDVTPEGTLANSRVFLDVSAEKEEGLPDGLKVDTLGYIYATGPGGIWIITPQGKHLGTIKPDENPANCGWGDSDAKTLYMTAKTGLYRIRLKNAGIRP